MPQNKLVYRFGGFVLDLQARSLTQGGTPVQLTPKALNVLAVLVRHRGRVVCKEQLLDEVWPGSDVQESSLTQNIHVVRQALRLGGLDTAIATVPGQGYRFLAQADYEPPRPRYRLVFTLVAAACLLPVAMMFVGRTPVVSQAGTLRPEAERLYSLGRYYWNLRTPDGRRRSLHYFEAAAAMAPRNAIALAGLADAYTEIVDYTCIDIRPCNAQTEKARQLAAQALRLDPKSAAAHASQAQILRILDRNYAASDAQFRTAISLDPSYAPARAWYGFSLMRRGLFSDARAQLLSAAALDPVATATNSALAEDAYFTRNFEDAIRYAKDALVLDPRRAETFIILGMAYERLGKYNTSIRAYNDARHAGWNRKDVEVLIATAESERGDIRAGQRAAQSLPRRCGENVALLFAALHRLNDAAQALRCTVEGRGDPFAGERQFDPRLDALKGTSVGS